MKLPAGPFVAWAALYGVLCASGAAAESLALKLTREIDVAAPRPARTPAAPSTDSGTVITPVPLQIGRDAETRAERDRVEMRVRPVFNSVRYGTPAYCQLAETCPDEIKRGADDESEMGVYHDLFQPQREANLRARLDEFTPAGVDAGIIFAT